MHRVLLTALTVPLCCAGAELPADQTEFFEAKIRPVLASACYDCHGAARQKSGLRLDWKDGLLKGGERGPTIVPGDPDKSLLLQAISHTHAELKMPKNADALSAATIADFREWVRMGAPDPRDKPAAESTADWPSVFALRKQWWCWQPPKLVEPPVIPGVEHPVDRFLTAAMQKQGLSPALPADPATILRRVSFILTGLPPSPDEVASFTQAQILNPKSEILNQIDRLLASPQFGERWARHWMDWLRYAESHGSEGDPAIPHAWQYRDYLIRALNADVSYPQLVKEHLAGDLLPPRLSADGTINEGAIGPAHLRMVFHGFTPTDALDEFVNFTDNQVDVVSKAFLGLTVSCARCHNHKFDAISQEDYYALYGVFANCRPATISAMPPSAQAETRERMTVLKEKIKCAITTEWEASFATFPQRLAAWRPANEEQRTEADASGHGPLAAWLRMRDVSPEKFAETWQAVSDAGKEWSTKNKAWKKSVGIPNRPWWNGHRGTLTWQTSGPGVETPVDHSEFLLLPDGERIIESLLPPGYASSRFSPRDRAVVASSPFNAQGGRLWVRVAGSGSGVRYVVQNYPRSGLIFPRSEINSAEPRWLEFNLDYWKGDSIHLEAWTAADAPIETGGGERQAFTLLEVACPVDAESMPPEPGVPLEWFAQGAAPANRAELLALYTEKVRLYALCGQALREGSEFINFFIRSGLLPNTLAALPAAAPLVDEYRRLEKSLTPPVRVPGVMEGSAKDHPLYARGDHKKPGEMVPRRFLSAIDAAPYKSPQSGRLELARSLCADNNPLANRVIVNRLWHHVFGRGLVATTDNFGKLGELPTHPELHDWLALRFEKDGGSIKKMLKLLLTSQTFMAASQPSPQAAEKDPENKLLSHWTLRRMEAEAIRDAILSVSGKLDLTAGGPAVDGATPRRSVYVKVIRNDLDPFLTAFDSPVPSSTRGRRDVTNVPAQALALMNSPMIRSWADAWADRVCLETADETARVQKLFRTAFQREPLVEEVQQSLAFVHDAAGQAEMMKAQADTCRKQLAAAESERRVIYDPVRRRLQNERKTQRPDPSALPQPLAEWDFENDASDSKGALPLKLHGNAKIEDGALVVDGNGSYASSPPLTKTLRAKTLEAWMQLATLNQSGGGVLTVQDLKGDIFDAIVFAEKSPREWVPGSNNFQRTQSTSGPPETEAASQPVHVAITWAGDGAITIFRNGQPYGTPYQSTGPVTFESGQSQILLGLRHGDPGGNRLLNARILRARLYDRALTAKELAISSQLEGSTISDADVLAALPATDRARYEAATRTAAAAQHQLADLTPAGPPSQKSPWRSLALALINMKEFIFLW